MEITTNEPIRVQSISQSNISEVPPQFIQPPQHRPTKPTHTTIPSIDLFNFNPSHPRPLKSAISKACREWGAFHITNHGLRTSLLNQMRSVGHSFFNDCSIQTKLRYSCPPNSAASEGYGSKMLVNPDDNDAVLDWRDYFDHHTFPLSRRNPTNWPDFPAEYRKVVGEYADEMMSLAKKLMGLISESLGLESSCVADASGELYQNITVSYYPPCPQPELTLGLQSHSDMGVVTLLIQDDVGGLEVLKDGEWVSVQPQENAIVVLLGDQTEIMTNGEYRSAVHRAVTNANRARLSVATFHDPGKELKISPLPGLVSESRPPRYRAVVYGDYVSSWYTKGPGGKRNIDALLINS